MGAANLDTLRQEAFEINQAIVNERLVVLTWGNASCIDRATGIIAIKPSGVPYTSMKWQDIVLVDLAGEIVDSRLRPSSDTLTHLELYKNFSSIGGIVHTHSKWATIWAQAGKKIPAIGTTHADHFLGDIPCLPYLSKEEVEAGYERQTGYQIVNFFNAAKLNPLHMPACLLAGHASFTWGKTGANALENAIALESCAQMAYHSVQLNNQINFPDYILAKHFERKHGVGAYYGQPIGKK